MPRVLPNPIVPTKVRPWLTIHPDHLHTYMHGRLMSVEVGDRASLSLTMSDPDRRGICSVWIHFGHVSLYNNLFERRQRTEFDSGLSSYFSESLGARLELPGVITLARKVLFEAEAMLMDEFDNWIRRPMNELLNDLTGRPLLVPTKHSNSVKPMSIGIAGNDFIRPTWTHPTSPLEAPELWAYWIWNQASQVTPDMPRRLAFRVLAMNLSVRCSLHTALSHIWEQIALPRLAEVRNLALPPALPHRIYEITDFDEHIRWDRICYPEVRVSSAPIIQHGMTISESSSSLVAETSTLSAIHQEGMQTYTVGTNPKNFSAPWLEAEEAAAESLSRNHPAWVSAPPPPAARVTNPAVDVRLLQEVMHLLHSQASQCRSYNGTDDIVRHAAMLR